jgi:hypothetical protein
VLLTDGPLTLREFMTNEEVPLAAVFREVLTWLGGRSDAVLFGAHAVNAYCDVERMTQDVDVLATDAAALAEELRRHLAGRFRMAVRVRSLSEGALRVYQVREPRNRQLVDVRQVAHLPEWRDLGGVRVIAPAELIARKVVAMAARRAQPKGATDLADVQRMLLAFPELKTREGPVAERLRALGATPPAMQAWQDMVEREIVADEDEG